MLFFDRQDYELLKMVRAFIAKDGTDPLYRRLFEASLHPNGIKVLAVSKEFRIAYAVVNLLDSLEAGKEQDRLSALAALRDEVLFSAQTGFRRNTARVLIQIMKELVRGKGTELSRLKLAHDFRMAASGRPRIVRALLKRYYLLEMPEAWNQLAFDHHVHDANTKGRKNPTHLIMDAWVKGLRTLTVVYYNYIEPGAARELLDAARIMDMTVRVGVEYQLRFGPRFIEFMCIPENITDTESMLATLADPIVQRLMQEGRMVSRYREKHVLMLLERYNSLHRHTIGALYGIELPLAQTRDFLAFVGTGQTSTLHLAEYVYKAMLPRLEERAEHLRAEYPFALSERKLAIDTAIEAMNQLDPDVLLKNWLGYAVNLDVPDPGKPSGTSAATVYGHSEDADLPELMRISPPEFLQLLAQTHRKFMVVLNLAGMSAGDVLEQLWLCEGGITHLELFNLKEWNDGSTPHLEAINELQLAINNGFAPEIKRIIRGMIDELTEGEQAAPLNTHWETAGHQKRERVATYREILRNIPRLQGFYKDSPLRARVGSDSTSRAARGMHGMGMVYPSTLPRRAQRIITSGWHSLQTVLPLASELELHEVRRQWKYQSLPRWLVHGVRRLPGLRMFGYRREQEWLSRTETTHVVKNGGNIASMGGVAPFTTRFFSAPVRQRKPGPPGLGYLSSGVANILKVLLGFVIAAAVFSRTQEWWLLAWLGAPIWFAITGVRNVVQSVLAGGGLRASPLLRWNNYVSWQRLCDSLMFTGISVLLLEMIVRKWLLQDTLAITVQDSPLIVFTVMAAANAVYISSHNLYRGFPKEAIIGNTMRSVFAIPLAVVYNEALTDALLLFGVAAAPVLMQQGSAIISKMASDSVAALIEGFADKANFIRNRRWDYDSKLTQLYDSISALEILYPEDDVMLKLRQPGDSSHTLPPECRDSGEGFAYPPDSVPGRGRLLERTLIINALDLFYFWMYQPRAREVLRAIAANMSQEERSTFLAAQQILRREREVSQLFVDGLVGQNFSRPLSFYLERHDEYLADMERLMKSRTALRG